MNLSVLELLFDILNNIPTFQTLESSLKKLRANFTGPSDHSAHRNQLPNLDRSQFPQSEKIIQTIINRERKKSRRNCELIMNYQLPLNQGQIVEGDIDVFVRIIISNEGGLDLQDKSLASILQTRLESVEFIGDGLLEDIIEAHDMGEI